MNREHHGLFELVAMLIGCSVDRFVEHFDEGLGVRKDLQVSPLLIVFLAIVVGRPTKVSPTVQVLASR